MGAAVLLVGELLIDGDADTLGILKLGAPLGALD